jgi:hypothetical protein
MFTEYHQVLNIHVDTTKLLYTIREHLTQPKKPWNTGNTAYQLKEECFNY